MERRESGMGKVSLEFGLFAFGMLEVCIQLAEERISHTAI